MAEIKCPKCGEIIKLDKSSYDALLNDIEKEEIEKRIKEQERLIEEKFKAQFEKQVSEEKNKKDASVAELNSQIAALKLKLENSDNEKALAVNQAVAAEKEKLSKKETEIVELKGQISKAEQEKQLAIANAVQKEKEESSKKDSQIVELKSKITVAEQQKALSEKNLKEQYAFELKAKDEEIERWKNYRVGDSTKDLGENLEKYCHDAFDEIRADAYPNAYFEKDNESVKEGEETKGTKGDFIFRDYSPEGIELVSILFDMKTEKDTTESKKTNESHLKKLDSDRNKKGCEYAVLVSTLEEDSKLYNRGIVDVSHRYPKMFVIRPQFFLAIIGLIRNLALKSYEYKRQVVQYQRENIDVTNFEKAVQAVAGKISDDYASAAAHYENAEKFIDDIIAKLNKLKEEYRLVAKKIGTAQNRLPELEVRKLVKDNPTMKEKFDALKNKKE